MNLLIRMYFCGTFAGVFYFFLGCSSTNNANIYEGKLRYEYDTIFKTYSADFTMGCGTLDLLTNGKTTYVAYNNCLDNTVKIVNFANDSVDVLSHANPSDTRHSNTRILDHDFYTIIPDNKIYIYCNRQAKREFLIDLMDIPIFQMSGLTVDRYKPGSDQHVNIPKNVVYFRVTQNYDDTLGVCSNMDFGFPAFAKLNIATRQLAFYGVTPRFHVYQTYGFPSRYQDLYVGDSIITNNGINGEIQIINTKNGEIIQKEVKSRLDTVLIQKREYSDTIPNYTAVKWNHYVFSPSYESIFYNPHTNYYYRIFHPKMNAYNERGYPNTESDKQSVLMVFNDNFELVDEVMLPPIGRMMLLKLYPAENGVLIALPELWKKTPKKTIFCYLRVSHFEK